MHGHASKVVLRANFFHGFFGSVSVTNIACFYQARGGLTQDTFWLVSPLYVVASREALSRTCTLPMREFPGLLLQTLGLQSIVVLDILPQVTTTVQYITPKIGILTKGTICCYYYGRSEGADGSCAPDPRQ